MKINSLLACVALLALAVPAHADIITFDGYASSAGKGNTGKDAQGNKWLWDKTGGKSEWDVGTSIKPVTFETKTSYVATDFSVSFVYFQNTAINESKTVFESEQGGKWYTWIPTYDGTKNVVWNAPAGVSLTNGEDYYVDVVFNKGTVSGANAGFTAAFSAVPELSTWVMMLAGFSALGLAGYRRRPVVA